MIQLDYKMEEIFIDIESFRYFLKSTSLSAIFQTYYSDLQKVFSSESISNKKHRSSTIKLIIVQWKPLNVIMVYVIIRFMLSFVLCYHLVYMIK